MNIANAASCCIKTVKSCMSSNPTTKEDCDRAGGTFNKECCSQDTKFSGQCRSDCSNGSFVSLNSFNISYSEKAIYASWETGTEEHNLGMNLWCAQMHNNQFQEITQLNSELIPSKAILPNYGASYSSTDYPYVNTNLKPGVQHCALEDIDASGQCTLHCDQIDTTIVGKEQNIIGVDLNELNAKAIALCHQYEDKLAETGQKGICLDQLLISH